MHYVEDWTPVLREFRRVLTATMIAMLDRFVGAAWGKVDLDMTSTVMSPGDALQGSITVSAWQNIGPGRVTITLVCRLRDRRTTGGVSFGSGGVKAGHSTKQRSREVWRSSEEVASNISLSTAQQQTFEFAIAVPDLDDPREQGDLPDWAVGAMAIIDSLTMRQRDLDWRLKAKFHHPTGIDLRCSRSIHVNMS